MPIAPLVTSLRHRISMACHSHATTPRASSLGCAMPFRSHPVTATRIAIDSSVGGSIALHRLLLAQRFSLGLALRVKIQNLADANGAVTGPFTEIHIVKGGAVEDATVVPNGYSVLAMYIGAYIRLGASGGGGCFYLPMSCGFRHRNRH